jgi:hypothetical protein
MTYLDPSHPHSRNATALLVLRIAFVLGLLAFGWFALTVGTQPDGTPTIVQEPVNGGL